MLIWEKFVWKRKLILFLNNARISKDTYFYPELLLGIYLLRKSVMTEQPHESAGAHSTLNHGTVWRDLGTAKLLAYQGFQSQPKLLLTAVFPPNPFLLFQTLLSSFYGTVPHRKPGLWLPGVGECSGSVYPPPSFLQIASMFISS